MLAKQSRPGPAVDISPCPQESRRRRCLHPRALQEGRGILLLRLLRRYSWSLRPNPRPRRRLRAPSTRATPLPCLAPNPPPIGPPHRKPTRLRGLGSCRRTRAVDTCPGAGTWAWRAVDMCCGCGIVKIHISPATVQRADGAAGVRQISTWRERSEGLKQKRSWAGACLERTLSRRLRSIRVALYAKKKKSAYAAGEDTCHVIWARQFQGASQNFTSSPPDQTRRFPNPKPEGKETQKNRGGRSQITCSRHRCTPR